MASGAQPLVMRPASRRRPLVGLIPPPKLTAAFSLHFSTLQARYNPVPPASRPQVFRMRYSPPGPPPTTPAPRLIYAAVRPGAQQAYRATVIKAIARLRPVKELLKVVRPVEFRIVPPPTRVQLLRRAVAYPINPYGPKFLPVDPGTIAALVGDTGITFAAVDPGTTAAQTLS